MKSSTTHNSVLFVLPLPPPIHGASLRNLALAKSSLIHDRLNVNLVPLQFAKSNYDIGKFSLIKIFKFIKLFFNVLRHLVKQSPSLVYYNMATYGFALYRDAIIINLIKQFGVKILLHLRTQGVSTQVKSSNFKRTLFIQIFKRTSVVCLSHKLSEDISEVYNGRTYILNDGIEVVNTSQIKVNPRRSGKVRFLFISNFVVTKGIFDILEAAGELSDYFEQFEIWIVGKEAEIKTEEINSRIKELHLTDVVSVKNPVYDEEKTRTYLESDVFLFPTYFDAFPGVILEAMQFGLPIISTYEGAIPEMVESGNALLINQRNVKELSEAMLFMIRNKSTISEMGEYGKKLFNEKYTNAIYEDNALRIFEDVILSKN